MSSFVKRLQYYLIGVVLGVIFVYFLFGNRDFQCSYFPNSRVLKDIRAKTIMHSELAECQVNCLELDSLDLKQFFAAGVVEFSNSEPRKEPCGEYEIVTRLPDMREIHALVQNCDSIATILKIEHAETDCVCD